MTKILGVSGSPRRHGNTEILLDRALDGASQAGAAVEKIVVSELCIGPCRGCFRCIKSGVCAVKDDMRLIYRKFDEADGIILASPIYFGSISAQLKTMIDRFNSRWVMKYMLKKSRLKKKRMGIFLCCAGEDKISFFANARSIIRFFFITLDIKYTEGIFCGGVSEAGEILNRVSSLKRSFDAGSRLGRVIVKI
ncbi:MAG: flavodoxin family protein [Candidatus Omnitrophota bacterium]|nr:flavodoxin family protein [Candidatus Omnitrophota bacterium]